MTELIIFSRQQAEQLIVNSKAKSVAIISITDPDMNDAKLSDGYSRILRLQFYDVEESPREGIHPISIPQALKIAYFVHEVWDKLDILIVHCEAGISRSAAVAAAIARYYLHDGKKYFKDYWPNKLCYTLVLTALEETAHYADKTELIYST